MVVLSAKILLLADNFQPNPRKLESIGTIEVKQTLWTQCFQNSNKKNIKNTLYEKRKRMNIRNVTIGKIEIFKL